MISVILPVWNGELYVKEALSSVLAQDYPLKEVIAIDDGSTDKTAEILESFCDKIRFFRQENRGLGASRNRAIQQAHGEFFAFLDHDDLWAPQKLSLQMEALSASHGDPLVFAHVEQFVCESLSEEERKKVSYKQGPLPGYIAGTLLLSRKRFFDIGPFKEERKMLGEFIEWFLRAKEKNVPTLLLPDLLYHRRLHKDNMGRRDAARRGDYLKILQESLVRRREKAP